MAPVSCTADTALVPLPPLLRSVLPSLQENHRRPSSVHYLQSKSVPAPTIHSLHCQRKAARWSAVEGSPTQVTIASLCHHIIASQAILLKLCSVTAGHRDGFAGAVLAAEALTTIDVARIFRNGSA